jgi:hypothetical protein
MSYRNQMLADIYHHIRRRRGLRGASDSWRRGLLAQSCYLLENMHEGHNSCHCDPKCGPEEPEDVVEAEGVMLRLGL